MNSAAPAIPTTLDKMLAFAFSAIFVGMVSSIWANYLTYLRQLLFLAISTNMVLMENIGGKGTAQPVQLLARAC